MIQIEAKGLSKTFGSVCALNDLNMQVEKGSIYGLVGPNGAGKTTLLQHVAGVMRPDVGEVLVGDKPVFESPVTKESIAYVPSDFYFYRQARVGDMRALYASLFGGFDGLYFNDLVSGFGLDETRAVRSLSKGMQKQLALCLSLARRPEVLLLDEPLDGLDPSARRAVLGIVMDHVAERQMTVLVSSHNLRELTDVCDHVGIMETGYMHLERGLEELQSNFVKVQVAFANDAQALPAELAVVHEEWQGRLRTLVVRASAEEAERVLNGAGATFVNVLPLSLEEIFIYEVGQGHDALARIAGMETGGASDEN